MIINKKNILLLSALMLFLIIYPYSKQVTIFRANDVSWDILNHIKKYKKFDYRDFTFIKKYNFPEKVLSLNGKEIIIKGFIKNQKHGSQTDIILTETVTDVCFMCNHDEHYNMILLEFVSENKKRKFIKNDTYVEVRGIFKINKKKEAHYVYVLEKTEILKIL